MSDGSRSKRGNIRVLGFMAMAVVVGITGLMYKFKALRGRIVILEKSEARLKDVLDDHNYKDKDQ
jgi:hypothetical protein